MAKRRLEHIKQLLKAVGIPRLLLLPLLDIMSLRKHNAACFVDSLQGGIKVELFTEYVERFGCNFPLFLLQGVDESEINKIILNCLENNTPHEAEDLGPEYDY